MARAETMVQLTDELVRLLDAEAKRRGVSRSAVIRGACEAFLKAESEEAMIQRWIDGYRRIPQGAGGPDDEELERLLFWQHIENMRALDEEERRAGFDPW